MQQSSILKYCCFCLDFFSATSKHVNIFMKFLYCSHATPNAFKVMGARVTGEENISWKYHLFHYEGIFRGNFAFLWHWMLPSSFSQYGQKSLQLACYLDTHPLNFNYKTNMFSYFYCLGTGEPKMLFVLFHAEH